MGEVKILNGVYPTGLQFGLALKNFKKGDKVEVLKNGAVIGYQAYALNQAEVLSDCKKGQNIDIII